VAKELSSTQQFVIDQMQEAILMQHTYPGSTGTGMLQWSSDYCVRRTTIEGLSHLGLIEEGVKTATWTIWNLTAEGRKHGRPLTEQYPGSYPKDRFMNEYFVVSVPIEDDSGRSVYALLNGDTQVILPARFVSRKFALECCAALNELRRQEQHLIEEQGVSDGQE
jgi:hypothetical protein